MSIALTSAAAEEMRKVIQQQGLDPAITALVVTYKPRGLPEQRFDMKLQEVQGSIANGDECLESNGIKICCDQDSYRFVKGITIDLQEANGQRGFAILKPKAHWPLAEPFAAPWLEEALRQVMDPEVGLNIVDLGLVYETKIEADKAIVIMTMTTPACPMTEMILADVEAAIRVAGKGITEVRIELVWDPPWTRDMISRAARQQMGWK